MRKITFRKYGTYKHSILWFPFPHIICPLCPHSHAVLTGGGDNLGEGRVSILHACRLHIHVCWVNHVASSVSSGGYVYLNAPKNQVGRLSAYCMVSFVNFYLILYFKYNFSSVLCISYCNLFLLILLLL